ncbi:MAG: helix-turn-helix domain-containing protein [Terricaulis sp.]
MKTSTDKKIAKPAGAEAMLDLSVAVIELYFRLEATTQAIAGFAHAGGEWGVLRSLIDGGPQTVPDMARARPVSRQHCQTIVNGLEAQGLVEFIANPKHARSQLVRVTRKGRAWYKEMTDRFLLAAGPFGQHFEAREVASATGLLRSAREILGT